MLQRNKNTIQLKTLAEIRFGYHGKPTTKGTIKYLQTKHLNEDSNALNPVESFLNANSKNESHILKEGEILLAGKGNRNTAWTYRCEIGNAIASSIFFVITVDENQIIPEYLTTIFNAAATQAYFQTLSAGSSIPSIRKSELEVFAFSLPTLEKQQSIVNLKKLHQQEIQLSQQIIKHKQDIFQTFINQLIHE